MSIRRSTALLASLVEISLRYKFLVRIVFTPVMFLGVRALQRVPVDAFPGQECTLWLFVFCF